MAKSTAIRGKDLMLFINNYAVGLATNCSLSISRATIDAKTKDDGIWSDNDAGDMNWEISSDALYATDNVDETTEIEGEEVEQEEQSYRTMYNAMVNGSNVTVIVGLPQTTSASGKPDGGWVTPDSNYYTGSVVITKLDLNGAKGDNASYTMSAAGTGVLSYYEEEE